MHGREKATQVIKSLALALVASALMLSVASVGWSETDHHIVVLEARSLEEIVESELQSRRFAEQIATYNGIAAITTVIPTGTTLQIPNPYMLDRDFGEVVYAKGDVVHTQNTRVVNPPGRGAFVYTGDTFSTGEDGFVSLQFSSGSVVNIQPESRVAVTDIACLNEQVSCVIELNAQKGIVESQITPRPDGQPPVKFKVTTPFLSAAVRGTAFYVNVDKGTDRIGVTHGLVATDIADATLELPKGKGLQAEANVEPLLVDLLEAPELIGNGSNAVVYSEEDIISWLPIDEAELYRFTIAEDESFGKPVLTSDLQLTTTFLPEGLLPGEYHLKIAGVDNKDFLGLSSSIQFSYAEIDDREQLELEIERTDGVVGIAPVDYSGSVEIHISEGFNNPTVQRRVVDSLSDGLSLELDAARDWVIRARKVFSSTSVSIFSNQYFLQAQE